MQTSKAPFLLLVTTTVWLIQGCTSTGSHLTSTTGKISVPKTIFLEDLPPSLSTYSSDVVSFLNTHGFEFLKERTGDCLSLNFRYNPDPWHSVVGIHLLESGKPLVVGEAVNPGWGTVIAPDAALAGLAGKASEEFRKHFLLWKKQITLREPNIARPATPRARYTGTGFYVSNSGQILTAYHLIQGASRIVVKNADGSEEAATIDKVDPQNDLALLKTGKDVDVFLELSSSKTLQIGDPVFTLGFPASDLLGKDVKFTGGEISALSGLQGSQSMMQITVPVQPGNSGGPLFTQDGRVVGIVTSSAAIQVFLRLTGTLPQNVNWAVKVDYAKLLFDAPPVTSTLDGRNRAALAKGVCFISAE